MRRWMYQVHLWLGLTLGTWLVLSSLTGAVLLWRHPIDRALNPHLLRPAAAAATTADSAAAGEPRRVQAMLDALRAHVPGAVPNRVRFAADEYLVDEVRFTLRGDESGGRRFAYFDPATGRLLGARGESESFVGAIFVLHADLMLGQGGHTANGVGAIVGTVLLGTGLFLWWPRKWAQLGPRMRVSRGTSAKRQVHDLHNVAGIYSLPVLLVLCLTGMAIIFHEPVEALVRVVTFTREPAEAPVAAGAAAAVGAVGAGVAVDADVAIAQAEAAKAGLEVQFVFPPRAADGPWRLMGVMEGSADGRFVQVLVDGADGSVREVRDRPPTRADRVMGWVTPLHFGNWGGTFSKLLYLLAAMAPVVLLVTGWMKWRAKCRGRAANRARRAEAAEGEVAVYAGEARGGDAASKLAG